MSRPKSLDEIAIGWFHAVFVTRELENLLHRFCKPVIEKRMKERR